MASGIRSVASIVIVMMSIVFLSFVVVVLYACIITSSCRFVNPYRGQFWNFLRLVQPTIDCFVDDNQNGDDEKSMHCLFPCCCCLLCSHYIYIIGNCQPLSWTIPELYQSISIGSYQRILMHYPLHINISLSIIYQHILMHYISRYSYALHIKLSLCVTHSYQYILIYHSWDWISMSIYHSVGLTPSIVYRSP